MLDDTTTGYLRRLGLDHLGPPSAEALAEILRAHVERVAYNTVDIQLGQPTPIAPGKFAAHDLTVSGQTSWRTQPVGLS